MACLDVYAADNWTGWRDVDDIYTYRAEDTLYVYLNGVSCPNVKNYFSINPAHMDNAKQLIAMVMAAKFSKAKVNVLYDADLDSTYCYFRGLKIQN